MTKNFITSFTVSCLLLLGCSKKNDSGSGPGTATSSLKIEIVSGSGQTDTVGLQLASSVIVKVTQNGTPVSNSPVIFQGSGCNQGIPLTANTQSNGTAAFIWHLAGDVGPQTLKAYALNTQNQKVDSATATATGIAAGSGWQTSACSLQGGSTVLSLCKLSTGRIFACYEESAYIKYSDDNGASWYLLTSLGNAHNFMWLMSSAADELYAFSSGEATLYSKDGGQTWTHLSAFPFTTVTSGICTPDGKLIITGPDDVSVSADKGQTWVHSLGSAFVPPNSTGGDTGFASPTEDQSGNLYVVGRESETIYQSKDGGNTWAAMKKSSNYEFDYSFYVDANNWFYKAESSATNGGLSISKDQGATYTQFSNTSNTFFDLFSVQSDGNYYYENTANGLYQSTGISPTVKVIQGEIMPVTQPYIVAKNGNVVLVYSGGVDITYLPK